MVMAWKFDAQWDENQVKRLVAFSGIDTPFRDLYPTRLQSIIFTSVTV